MDCASLRQIDVPSNAAVGQILTKKGKIKPNNARQHYCAVGGLKTESENRRNKMVIL